MVYDGPHESSPYRRDSDERFKIKTMQRLLKIRAKAHRTPSISAPRNYVYKHVYIYFSAAGQAKAVGSLESGNLMVYGPLYTMCQLKVVLHSRIKVMRLQPHKLVIARIWVNCLCDSIFHCQEDEHSLGAQGGTMTEKLR